ncbi:MAG: hypothetical protein KC484_02625 [Colwelliaceae bacterium]|nr:hypothetical protein [Colwelliaceae bacterium]
MTEKIEIPKWFKNTAIIALIWNLLGLMAFISHMMMTPEMISDLSVQEQELYKDIPLWATAAFAIAVLAGTFGSALLFLKRSIAKPLFIASLIGVILQNYHSFFVIDSMTVYGVSSVIMPMMVIIIAIALIMLSSKAEKNGWIN